MQNAEKKCRHLWGGEALPRNVNYYYWWQGRCTEKGCGDAGTDCKQTPLQILQSTQVWTTMKTTDVPKIVEEYGHVWKICKKTVECVECVVEEKELSNYIEEVKTVKTEGEMFKIIKGAIVTIKSAIQRMKEKIISEENEEKQNDIWIKRDVQQINEKVKFEDKIFEKLFISACSGFSAIDLKVGENVFDDVNWMKFFVFIYLWDTIVLWEKNIVGLY